jgi:anti-anti-sigma regulatory factor
MARMVVVRLDTASMVWLSGRVCAALAPILGKTLGDLLDQVNKPPVLDLTQVPSIDEGAVRVLAEVSSRAAKRTGGLELRLPRGQRRLVTDASMLRTALITAYPSAA